MSEASTKGKRLVHLIETVHEHGNRVWGWCGQVCDGRTLTTNIGSHDPKKVNCPECLRLTVPRVKPCENHRHVGPIMNDTCQACGFHSVDWEVVDAT